MLLSMVSCRGSSADAPVRVAIDSLVVDSICPLFRNYSQPACHIALRLDRPAATTASTLVSALEKSLIALPRDGALVADAGGTIEGMANAYIRQFIFQYLLDGKEAIDSYHGDTESAASWMNYEEVVDGRVLYNEDGFLSYQYTIYSYAGGAHGNTIVRNCVFDCQHLKPLSLGHLFMSIALDKVNELLRHKLMSQYGCTTVEEMTEKTDFFNVADLSATDNFLIDANGVTWTYDPYEIAPYSMGTINISLSWLEVRQLLLPDSPLKDMAEKYGF